MSNQGAWYRHPWVWVVFMIPFSAVAVGIVMLVTVAFHPDDLVVDDYYKQGMAINQRIGMDVAAGERDIRARSARLSSSRVEFHIENVTDPAVVMNLYHVTDKGQDRRIVLASEGSYTVRRIDRRGIAFRNPGRLVC
ncbi:MAG: FixH family protein [Gammaproteobacteria bacterium]|nr:FixH family protein [Gammaproteobacteria bacterium]